MAHSLRPDWLEVREGGVAAHLRSRYQRDRSAARRARRLRDEPRPLFAILCCLRPSRALLSSGSARGSLPTPSSRGSAPSPSTPSRPIRRSPRQYADDGSELVGAPADRPEPGELPPRASPADDGFGTAILPTHAPAAGGDPRRSSTARCIEHGFYRGSPRSRRVRGAKARAARRERADPGRRTASWRPRSSETRDRVPG